MRRTFDMTDLVEIMAHWYSGRSYTQVARSLGIDRGDRGQVHRPGRAEGILPGGPPVSEEQWREKLRGWFPKCYDKRLCRRSWDAIAPHHGRAAELVKVVPVSVAYQRWPTRWASPSATAASGATSGPVRRGAPRGGGHLAPAVGPGKKRKSTTATWAPGRTRPPATTAGCGRSRWCCRTRATCSCARYYGWTRRPGPIATWLRSLSSRGPGANCARNLRAGVVRPDLYDPKLNRSYAELANYYNVLLDPARAFLFRAT